MANPEEDGGAASAESQTTCSAAPASAAAAAAGTPSPADAGSSNKKEDWQVQRDASKYLGDTAFKKGDFKGAIEGYTAALSLDPESAVLLSNRSAAYLRNSEKSKALKDARACVELGTMGSKGYSRLAAALQSLGRFEQALENWKLVVKDDPKNAAAQRGVEDCQREVDRIKKQQAEEEEKAKKEEEEKEAAEAKEEPKDDLDDFFNDVETAASQVAKEKEIAAAEAMIQKPTDAIKKSKKGLGTAKTQIERLLQTNYKWKNLNPYYVLDVPHTATKEEISKRYKAMSLLLHPDKNTNEHGEKAQLAYDEVLKAKQILDDDLKANHCKQLAEQGMLQGQAEWERKQKEKKAAGKHGHQRLDNGNDDDTLEDLQLKAVHKIFAEVEYRRREVEKRERNHDLREKQKEEEEEQKVRNERKFDKSWKKEERVEKRIGNWRQFQTKKQKKK